MSSQERILTALREAREQIKAAERRQKEPIAIVGIGCRLPGGVESPDDYWALLRDGVDAMTEVPADRWDINEYYDPDPEAPGKVYAREAGHLSNVDLFDPQFFRISPREALTLDPQQRLLLEVTWEALEDAGESADRVRGSNTGFYVGFSWHDYERNAYGMNPDRLDAYSAMGNTQSIAVGRLAFMLGTHGPTSLMDTACSSSLVAVHTACQTLRSGEADMIVAGGVNLMISPLSTIFCCKVKALSADSRCKTFDAAADGYARGEGCGMIVLKRLSDAVADGNHIRAVIRGTAINHDGPSSGLTVPNRSAQVDVIRRALDNGDIDPLSVGFVEAHGTGTSLGDPIEVGALGDALGRNRGQDRPLRLGSCKTNFGHLEAAAGIAGLIKAVLAIEHNAIPPHLHFNQPSPNIDWDAFPVEVPTSNTQWHPGPKIAGVSSFGFSGTNAHVILGEAPAEENEPAEASVQERHVLCLSARDDMALRDLALRYADYLPTVPELSLADICHTAHTGRARFPCRLAVSCKDTEQLANELRQFSLDSASPNTETGRLKSGQRDKVAFLFTGQGSQWTGMGKSLYAAHPVFRQAMDRCNEILAGELDYPLLDIMFGEQVNGSTDLPLLDRTAYTQPALFALEWSLSELWRAWGVIPSLAIGHSVGEYVAACVAGVFSLEDGLKLIAARGRLMQGQPTGGAMVAVSAAENVVQDYLAGRNDEVSVAAVNGPRSTVISGRQETVAEVTAALAEKGIETRQLTVSHAFHSPLMDPVLEEFEITAAGVTFSTPRIGLISNVLGRLAVDEFTRPEYWRRHIREPVLFADGIQALDSAGATVYLELGPHPVLTGMGRQCVDNDAAGWLSSLIRGQDDWEQILKCRGQLFLRGVEQDWSPGVNVAKPRRVRLPTYPFQRKRYWIDAEGYGAPGTLAGGGRRSAIVHPLLGRRLSNAALAQGERLYESQVSTSAPAYLADHRVFDHYVPPATCYIEMLLALANQELAIDTPRLEDFTVHQPLFLDPEESTTLQCVVKTNGNDRFEARVLSLARAVTGQEGEWILHASASITSVEDGSAAKSALDDGLLDSGTAMSPEDCYRKFSADGLDLGLAFRVFTRLSRADDVACAEVEFGASRIEEVQRYLLYPALIDACGQLIACAFPPSDGELYLPIGTERITLYRAGCTRGTIRGRLRPAQASLANLRVADLDLFDEDGNLVLCIEGAATRLASRDDVLRTLPGQGPESYLYRCTWQESALPTPAGSETLRNWLVIGSDAEKLVALMRESGEQVSVARKGKGFDVLHDGDYVINPDNLTDIASLLESITDNAGSFPSDILVHSESSEESAGHYHPAQWEAQNAGRIALLLQALARNDYAEQTRLWLVTRGTRYVDGQTDPVSLAGSSVWGLGAVVAMEHPELKCVRVDLPTACSEAQWRTLYDEIRQAGGDDQVVLRSTGRYVGRLQPVSPEDAGQPVDLVSDAWYLVTGGFGALGLALAQALVSRGARKLALLGRNGPGAGANSLLASLREQGTEIEEILCDVSSREDVDKALKNLQSQGTRIAGIFHAAGTLDDGVLLQMNQERVQRVMQSKVAGAWNLHEASLDLEFPPDHFVMFSSAASLLGSRGQGNYAAANAWLDTLAQFRRQQGLPCISVNWGPWGEVGMAAELDELATRRMFDMGWSPLATEEGMQLLHSLMGSEMSQVGVLPLDFNRFVRQFPATGVPAYFETVSRLSGQSENESVPDSGSAFLNQLLASDSGARLNLVEEFLQRKVGALIGLNSDEKPDKSAQFPELGIDSLLHMELRSEITRDLNISLPVTQFLDNPSIEALSELVMRQLALSSVSGKDADDDEDMEEITL